MGPTRALVTEGLTNFARNSINFEHVFGTKFRGSITILWQITLVLGKPAHVARSFGLTRFKITALARSARGVGKQSTRVWITTWVITMIFETTITFFSRLHKTISTNRAVKQSSWFVPQTIVHPMLKSQSQVLQTAG